MAVPQIDNAQRDFSAGELDADMKDRDDLSLMRAGGRQMSDWRILASGKIEQRAARRHLFAQTGRTDEIEVAPGMIYRLCFGADGTLRIRDAAGAVILTQPGFPWNAATVDRIVWTQVKVSLSQTDAVICFPGMRTAVARYDGVTPWTVGDFDFGIGADGIKATAFYRLAAPGATMAPSAGGAAGTPITLLMSAAVFVAGHVNTVMRFANSRMLITAVTDATHATATLLEQMNPTQKLTTAALTGGTTAPVFIIGQAVSGSITNARGVVVAIAGADVTVQILAGQSGFTTNDTLVGPTTSAKITVVAAVAPIACAVWDEEIISTARGWPQSCFTDRGRLGFCDLPSATDAVMWSATNLPYYFTVGALATDAMVEIATGKPHIYHVMPGNDELVFTSKGVFYIPITSGNVGLKPGSVEFVPVSGEAASTVRPAMTTEGFLYVTAGRNRINAVIGDGAAFSARPYRVADVSQFHKHLFTGLCKGLAVATGDDPNMPERYVYVVHTDGSVAVGRYQGGMQSGKEWVGWLPWKGQGTVNWISALFANVLFTTSYGGYSITEVVDDTIYLDAAISLTDPARTALWLAVARVTLMDGLNNLGEHLIDADGNIVPAQPGEDLSSPTILAGLPFAPILEPFVPNAEPGENRKQRTRRRRIKRVLVSVSNSTGFLFAKLYSGPAGANLPAPGSIMPQGFRRIPAYNQGDDQSQAPPLREQKYAFSGPTGRSYHPRFAIIKDTPGPLRISEVGEEATT